MKRILAKIRKLFYKKADQCKQEKAAYVDGIPDGIAFETLNELCLHHLGESLKHVSHLHLSSWKAAGACRLLLRTQGHHHWSLIYKNAFYGLDHIPALADLPVVPGPPEFVVYNNIKGHLAQYLPAVYLCSEVVPKRHYQYLLEDLGEDYQRANKPEAILSVAAELPSFHGAMNKWSLAVGKDGLLRYGDRFSADLQQYVRRILESYVRSRKDKMVSEVLRLWSGISEVHGRREFHDSQNVSQIHGDFGPSNILINKEYPHRIKLIDWEWAGSGIAHADLASLLKGVSPEIERYALVIFSRQNKILSLGEHVRLYHWCQLERGLLDGGFVAAQYMNSPTTTRLNLPGFVEHSMQRVMRAYQKLI